MLIVKNWGYLATLGNFEIVAAENGETAELRNFHNQAPLIDSFTIFT